MMVDNNLINITNRDFIYTLVAQRIGGYLPKDLQSIYNACEHIQIIATDCYFLHYTLYPFLRSRNEDEILEEVRVFMRDYMSEERYQKIKMLTTLDDEMSLVYSIALAKAIIGKVLGKLIGDVDISQILRTPALKSVITDVLSSMIGGELGVILDYASDEAEQVVKNANEIRELIGGKKAGKEAGTFKKTLDLAEHMLYVKFMRDIVTFSKKLLDYIPKASHIMKKRGHIGDELSGYSLTKRVDRALPRELALPEELFLKKFTSEGFLTKEKLSIAEGAYYILIDKCLDEETPVTLENREQIEIGDIEVGDTVLSVEFKEIGGITIPLLKRSKVVRILESGEREILRIRTEFGDVRATWNHIIPVYRNGRVFEIRAGEICAGDFIFTFDHSSKSLKLSHVLDVRRDGLARTYDITLKDHNHFIANDIVVHNSGSMVGEKTIWARSVAMALYRMAKVKRRKYFLRFFDTRVYPDSPIQEPEEIVDAILKVKSNGGTDITNALSTALRDLIESGLSEFTNTIVIITDGEDVVQDLSKDIKKANASLISVMIQGDNETLKALSDQYMKAELSEVGGAKLLKVVEVTG